MQPRMFCTHPIKFTFWPVHSPSYCVISRDNISIFAFQYLCDICLSKGVLRVRKRVTLTVIAVSVIFAICWGTSSVIYFMIYVTSCDFGHAGAIVITVADMMILFNSAVNPFVYALLNHQFREKIRRMTCCSRSSPSRIHPISNPPSKEFADDSAAHLSQIGGLGQSASLHVLYSGTC